MLIQAAPGRRARFLAITVESRVGQLDTQRNILDRHAEEVLEEDDAGLPPRDLGEIAGSLLDEVVDQSICLVADLGRQCLHSGRREVWVEHLAELLLPRRVKRDDQIARKLFGRFRGRITGEVLPVLQDLVAVLVSHRHPCATGCGRQERNVGVGERGSVPHDFVHVVEEVVVVEVLVAQIPVLRVFVDSLRHGAGTPCCSAAWRASRASWMRTSSRNPIRLYFGTGWMPHWSCAVSLPSAPSGGPSAG